MHIRIQKFPHMYNFPPWLYFLLWSCTVLFSSTAQQSENTHRILTTSSLLLVLFHSHTDKAEIQSRPGMHSPATNTAPQNCYQAFKSGRHCKLRLRKKIKLHSWWAETVHLCEFYFQSYCRSTTLIFFFTIYRNFKESQPTGKKKL